jgi:hypothetical protein
MDLAHVAQTFLNREPIEGVEFSHNDFVNVVSGDSAGMKGSLVTILTLDPEPRYLVELESGVDVPVWQSQLSRGDS